MRDIYTEQSAVQKLLRNGFKKEDDKRKGYGDIIGKYETGHNFIRIKSLIGLKLRSAIDYLKNHCYYVVMWN